MPNSIIFSLVYAIIGFLFSEIPQVRIHSAPQSEDIFYARLYIDEDIYEKRELSHGDTVYFLIKGEAAKCYEKGIEIDIEDNNYETSSIGLKQPFKKLTSTLMQMEKLTRKKHQSKLRFNKYIYAVQIINNNLTRKIPTNNVESCRSGSTLRGSNLSDTDNSAGGKAAMQTLLLSPSALSLICRRLAALLPSPAATCIFHSRSPPDTTKPAQGGP